MKRTILFCAVGMVVSLVMFAQTQEVAKVDKGQGLVKVGKKMVSREHLKKTLERVRNKRTGGYVRKAGTAKGYFVLLDAQKVVPAGEYAGALKSIDNYVRVQMKTVTLDALPMSEIKGEMAKAGGNIGVALVNDPVLPALLAAPEEGWGLVNVAKLADANKDKVASRMRREILRAFALAGGAMYAAQGDFVLQPVRKPEELDKLTREQFGATMLHIFNLALPYFDISPWYQTTYAKACEEGWAPMPTNEYQKAIWEKSREVPKNPMQIKFDPKSGK